jgi:tRNA 2-selenouridine synthase
MTSAEPTRRTRLDDPLTAMPDFRSYALVIDARSPREFSEDHVPTAVNLPVVDNDQYAEVGTLHKSDTHAAYLLGVEYALNNIARHIKLEIARLKKSDRVLVYCFRGGKRSKLWADNLRTIGFVVDVLHGGWKSYRKWVRETLESVPKRLTMKVLSGPTGCGKTRLLHALRDIGEQVIDLEGIARHRGSLIGSLPGQAQPSQKLFDSLLLDALCQLDPARPVWVEAESKKIGNVQLPDSLHSAMHPTSPYQLRAPIRERVRLWREDYAHFVANPIEMVDKLSPLKPLIGGEELSQWRALAATGDIDQLFERVMVMHYDPCYVRSSSKSYKSMMRGPVIELSSLDPGDLIQVATSLSQGDSGSTLR